MPFWKKSGQIIFSNNPQTLYGFDTAPRYLLRDRDAIYGERFRRRLHSLGIAEVPIAARSPRKSPYVERLIGSIRRECPDHAIVFNERHLGSIFSNGSGSGSRPNS